MKVETFVVGMVGTNCYLAENEQTKETVIIDPGAAPDYFLSHIKNQGLKPQAILLTHGHFDHIMGIEELLKVYEIPVYVHENEKELLADAKLNMAADFRAQYTYSDARLTRDEEVLSLAGYQFRVLMTPGHTAGGSCYYLESEQVLFSGDTLFRRSVGRSDFPTGNEAVLKQSIREKLLGLPDATIVYPGHNSATTIGEERNGNPFVR